MPRYYQVRFPAQVLTIPATDDIMSSYANRQAAETLIQQVSDFIRSNTVLVEIEVDATGVPTGAPVIVTE